MRKTESPKELLYTHMACSTLSSLSLLCTLSKTKIGILNATAQFWLAWAGKISDSSYAIVTGHMYTATPEA